MSFEKSEYTLRGRRDNPQSTSSRQPPPLPPRSPSPRLSQFDEAPPAEPPPPYSVMDERMANNHPYSFSGAWNSHDPRADSTESLGAHGEDGDVRRTLLLIYIHGFMGNETSFQSFPAHVHNLASILLKSSHIVHTKIYPRYRSRRTIDVVRDDFSKWLAPHESPNTDVILLGHSMGGLLSAEIVLASPYSPATGQPFRHRILGTINFDVPFLGMHPGVIASGLSSIFQPGDSPKEATSGETESPSGSSGQNQDYLSASSSSQSGTPNRVDTLFSPPSDPFFNPRFENDVNLPIRKGWKNTLHFITKHSDGLTKATKQLVKQHIEFGGMMADYGGLKTRYTRLRALEEDSERARQAAIRSQRHIPRTRFVNYYTASAGRPKRPKSLSPNSKARLLEESQGHGSMEQEMQDMTLPAPESLRAPSPHVSPRISVEEHSDEGVIPKPLVLEETEDDDEFSSEAEMGHIAPQAESDDGSFHSAGSRPPSPDAPPPLHPVTSPPPVPLDEPITPNLSKLQALPPLPPAPSEPPELDLSAYTDKDARKLAEKDHARIMRSYKQAVKDRNAAIKDRAKLEAKIEKERTKKIEDEKKAVKKAEEKEKADWEKEKKLMQKEKERVEKERKEQEEKARIERENEGLSQHDISERERLRKETERMEREARRMRGEPPSPPPSAVADSEPASYSTSPQLSRTTTQATQTTATMSPGTSISSSQHFSPLTNESSRTNSNLDSVRNESGRSLHSHSHSRPSKDKHKQQKPDKPKRDRKFCMLPKENARGERDETWIRVFMGNVDEVGAHCGLFFLDQEGRYERLVGEVASRIEEWVVGHGVGGKR
ncbi:hypothetical protein K402DRAFT_464562 [Aulographum hederae CBS 113979]|uniref:DUF676 domain-containing protein n=1 Tax=Aulographum hederae CBS 113979 TaxID=1176131 RepID=A0A6G1GWS0_9PEZI|nr:hypothetical protein K402DRAFT_464562 [Aulographum hederae CBS 113979]